MCSFTKSSYEASALEYAQSVAYLRPTVRAEKFISLLKSGARILDIGCGPGRDAKIFSERGLQTVGIDFSPKMILIAKKVAPKAEFQVMDIQTMDFPEASFDGIWANASLLHLYKKDLPQALNKIYRFLTPGGYFYLSMKMGEGEGLEKDYCYDRMKKYWSFFSDLEIQQLLEASGFHILQSRLSEKPSSYQTQPMIHFFSKKILLNVKPSLERK